MILGKKQSDVFKVKIMLITIKESNYIVLLRSIVKNPLKM